MDFRFSVLFAHFVLGNVRQFLLGFAFKVQCLFLLTCPKWRNLHKLGSVSSQRIPFRIEISDQEISGERAIGRERESKRLTSCISFQGYRVVTKNTFMYSCYAVS